MSKSASSKSIIDKIVRAVLYEGYILYPYRPSVKTQQRWTFGGIFPQAFTEAQPGSDPCLMQAQCLLKTNKDAAIDLCVCFLHLMQRNVEAVDPASTRGGDPVFVPVPSLQVAGRLFQTWQEAVERKVAVSDIRISDLLRHQRVEHFSFPHSRTLEILFAAEGSIGCPPAGRLLREQQKVDGLIEIAAEEKQEGVYQLTVRVENLTPLDHAAHASRDLAQLGSFASTHMVLTIRDGAFISLTDPPEAQKDLASQCNNIGCWPVLVGEAGATDALLASPIILSDYPEVAPESPGDLFDGCEIDEILTLRIMTLTDEEKRQAIAVDPLAADVMARTEAMARDELMKLHGTVRGMNAVDATPAGVPVPLQNEEPVMSEDYYG